MAPRNAPRNALRFPPLALRAHSQVGQGQGGNSNKVTEVKVIQVNLNKAHGAQVELLNKINKLSTYIALVTEPYFYKKKP